MKAELPLEMAALVLLQQPSLPAATDGLCVDRHLVGFLGLQLAYRYGTITADQYAHMLDCNFELNPRMKQALSELNGLISGVMSRAFMLRHPDIIFANGETPLTRTCGTDYVFDEDNEHVYDSDNREAFALKLIATGKSNPGHVDAKGNTALIIACEQEMPDVISALLATGQSNPGHVNMDGDTALIRTSGVYAWSVLRDAILELLATGQSNPGHADVRGDTALITACDSNNIELVLALIATGQSNPGHSNLRGTTALIVACMGGHVDIALALIATGQSNLGQVNAAGDTAMVWAQYNKLTSVISAIESDT
jgi:ankyrin repeat protein